MRVLVPAVGAALAPHHRRRRVDARATSCAHLGTPLGKIDVAPLGVDAVAAGRADAARPSCARGSALGDGRVLLTVSAKRPHKNLLRLLEAVALLESRARRSCCRATRRRTRRSCASAPRRSACGRCSRRGCRREDLEGLYALASAFVFPSLAEGFGLPVLEAMARGVPVACSDRSSLPEVAGDAALLFDPFDPRAIADALRADPGRGGRGCARPAASGRRASPGSAARS